MNIHESVEQIMKSRDVFGEAFYDVFFGKYPEAQLYFHGIDMKKQALVLTMAVSLIEQHHSAGYPVTEKYLRYLGTQHNNRSVPRDLYPKWRDAMLETLQRFLGEQWTKELSSQWQEAIDRCSKVMFEGYEQRFTV